MTQKAIYSLSEHWSELKPYLEHPWVLNTLDESMIDYIEQHFSPETQWDPKRGPWSYCRTDYWTMKIDNNPEFQSRVDNLFRQAKHENPNADEDDVWIEIYDTLKNEYYPKPGEIEWYQLKHGCHWISRFVASLLEVALPTANVDVVSTEYHSFVTMQFPEDTTLYYSDILNSWSSVENLEHFALHGDTTEGGEKNVR